MINGENGKMLRNDPYEIRLMQNLYDAAVKQNNQTTTSNFPCNFNFTVSNMNRFNQGIDHG